MTKRSFRYRVNSVDDAKDNLDIEEIEGDAFQYPPSDLVLNELRYMFVLFQLA